MRRFLTGLVVVALLALSAATSVLLVRDGQRLQQQRQERSRQIEGLCREITDLREGWVHSVEVAGVNVADPVVAKAIADLRANARCDPSEFG
jgi:hypothetical protein